MVLMMAALLAKYPVALEGEHRETMVFLYGTEFDQRRAHVRPVAPAAAGCLPGNDGGDRQFVTEEDQEEILLSLCCIIVL